ncbi:Helicase associated domain protein [Paenibacillus polymyxa]|uniref:Helicase associated domain protein n=1 Tax=Paenibacillus polymyxa TaxID=1406 RepID=UPI002AB4C2A8|nr:Helicase associated domain protein [Paenibacillus polymyxa]MDY8021212.1 Helicase associated domain protein [Paenibacillus polymyxa]
MTTHHGIELYPHNQETYDKIIEAWKTQNRVATVQATGTGKTFLILKCLFTYPDVNKVVLTPSNHILDQLSSKVDELPNTTLLTYTELSFMSKEAIQQLNASMIVLDEFHRCGAEKWGEGVNRLITAFPDAKLLGTTATPIRYLDGERDMSDELFDGNVVTNLNLTEAIVKSILPMPKYVSALYTFDEEIMNLKDKIDKSCNTDEEKEGFYKEVEHLKKKLDKSKGIPVILKKYLGDNTGKFIVFCRNKNHLMEMQNIVKGWFKKAKLGKSIDSYSVYTGKTESENNKTIEEFVSNNDDQKICLLFTIDMLNEGLHVEDVAGVICLRPTTSPIIYYQQIGRALQVGSKEPFVFDFVNNFNNLGGNTFENDLREVVEKENEQRKSKGDSELSLDDFIVYDETHDVTELFNELEERLNDGWDAMYERYKNGERGKFKTKLGNWENSQRVNYKNGLLSTDRTIRLNKIGFIWHKRDNNWNENFELLKDYRNKWGDCEVPRSYEINGVKLGKWVNTLRVFLKRNKLSQERIDRLNSIDFMWDTFNDSWIKNFNLLLAFKKENNHCNIPQTYLIQGVKLGLWVTGQRKDYKNNKLSQERIEKLKSIDFMWDPLNDLWDLNFNILSKYKSIYGDCDVVNHYEMDGVKLGKWVNTQRLAYRKNKLSLSRVDKLNSVGFQWDIKDKDLWDNNYSLLLIYKKKYGHCNVPFKYEVNGIKLGIWVNTQRQSYKNIKLSQEKINQFNSIGFQWSIKPRKREQAKTKTS